jgi:protein SCO1/2
MFKFYKPLRFVVLAGVIAFSASPTWADSSTMKMPMPKAKPNAQLAGPAQMGGSLLSQSIPASVLNTPLIDSNGKSFTLASLKGKTIVLADFFTSCDMICPMTTANMQQIGAAVQAAHLSNKIAVIELTIDPQRDTVSRLAAYKSLYGSNSWTVATGSLQQITALWKWFGVFVQKTSADEDSKDWLTGKPLTYDLIHADLINIIGPNQQWNWLDLGNPAVSNPRLVPQKLQNFLGKVGKLNLVKPQNPTWTPAAVYGALMQVGGFNVGPKMNMKM